MKVHRHWRLFEWKNDSLLTLFHGVEGSRTLPRGVWLWANPRMVHDGSPGSCVYLSGFHVFRTREGLEYLERFRKPRTLVGVEVEVKGLRVKPTNSEILLAEWMRIPEDAEVIVLKA